MKLQSEYNKYILSIRLIFLILVLIVIIKDARHDSLTNSILLCLVIVASMLHVSFIYFCITKAPEYIGFKEKRIVLYFAFNKSMFMEHNEVTQIKNNGIGFTGYKIKAQCTKKRYFLISTHQIEDMDLFISNLKAINPDCKIEI